MSNKVSARGGGDIVHKKDDDFEVIGQEDVSDFD
jgi:hypothetical protein